MNKTKAYYFSKKDCKLRHGDGREIKEGITHVHDGELELCKSGLHASKRAIDSLAYAPGSILWIVEVEDYIEGYDKICGRRRTYIKGFDAENLLREFARKQALINIEKIKPYCSDEDYSVIIEWLETGNEHLRSAAYAAAESAAYAAAESAAYAAAESVAESAAWFAAESAAWSVARSAAKSAANDMLEEMIEEAIWTLTSEAGYIGSEEIDGSEDWGLEIGMTTVSVDTSNV